MEDKLQLELVSRLIEQLAKGNFDIESEISASGDKIQTIVSGINLLSAELQNSALDRQKLENIYAFTKDAVVCVNKDFTIYESNPKSSILLEYSGQELQSQSLYNLIATESDFSAIKSLLSSEGHFKDFETELKQKNGNLITVSASGTSISDEHGRYLFLFKDLSHIKRAEEELAIKNKELEDFIYTASHQLKGPIATIIGLTSQSPDEMSLDEYKEYFQYIKKITTNLNQKIIDFAEFPAYGKMKYTLEDIDYDSLVENVLSNIKRLRRFNVDKVVFNVTSTLTNNHTNVKEMVTIRLTNLIENAVKFQESSSSPKVDITLSESVDGVALHIKDYGNGIADEFKSHAFDMFSTTDPVHRGSGLGLYIVKKLINRVHGCVKIEKSDTTGTTILVNLPDLID